MIKRLIGATVVALCLGGAAVSAAAPPTTTTPPAAPVPAPAPTQQPTGLGTDGAMDLLANACFNGTMQACDDLYAQSPTSSAYETFGDTCAGRQPAGTGRFCSDVFTDSVVQPTPTSTTPPTTVVGTVTPTMAAIHTICKPEALTAYATDYATKVPPTAQGVVTGLAEEQGMTVDAFLAAVLDDSLDSETQVAVIDAYQPAETPVGDATLTEYGLLTGRYLDCSFEATQIPQDIFDNLLDTDEGSGTWAGYTMTWGENDEGDFTITFTSTGAAPASTAPVTTAPVTPTTAPPAPTTAPAAPTTALAAPTTAPAAPTTAPAGPTTVPGSTGIARTTTEINTVDGIVAFTCSDILSIRDEPVECPDSFQSLFNDIVANDPAAFNTYIYDHDLGFFSTQEVNVPQTAFVGLWACLAMASQNPYTEYDTDIRGIFAAANPADTQRAWDTAALVLCPFLTQ
jgi:hypothetical protein